MVVKRLIAKHMCFFLQSAIALRLILAGGAAYSDNLITSQSSDTVTSIFKCNSSNRPTIKSLRLLKMTKFSKALEIFVSISWHPSFLVGSASVVFAQLAVETK